MAIVTVNGQQYDVESALELDARRQSLRDRTKRRLFIKRTAAVLIFLSTLRFISPFLTFVLVYLFLFLIFALLFYPLILFIFGKRLSSRTITTFLPCLLSILDSRFHHTRTELLKNISGNILDFGSGTGEYLKYIPKNDSSATKVTALEPNIHLHPNIVESIELNGLQNNVNIESRCIEEYASSEQQIVEEESKFDWIILGNVLCEVNDVGETVKVLDKVLKRGGCVYYSEHVIDDESSFRRRIQLSFIGKLWSLISDGCHCERDSVNVMQMNTDWEFHNWTIHIGGFSLISKFQLGIAHKPT
mmetsp:Transcript_5512/g.9711  ORF Transcript_5512/g.9711 Transcript_5512/m.9711 type:complete len:303 (-) Transcript_5512:3-911(-)